MIKMRTILLFCILSFACIIDAQKSLLTFQTDTKLSYKKALKLAKEKKQPVLAILYSPSYPAEASNQFSNPELIIEKSGVITVVIDWANQVNKAPQNRINDLKNPLWLFVHSEDIIVNALASIKTDEELEKFLQESRQSFEVLSTAVDKKNKSRRAPDFLNLANVASSTPDSKRTSEILDDYLKGVNSKQLNNKALKDVVDLAKKNPISKRVYRTLLKHKGRAIAVSDHKTVHNILVANIRNNLTRLNLLDPYNVWLRYEKELDFKADSLYRIFALEYFSQISIDTKALYDESFDFINIYPRADWALLDPLYNIVTINTTKKEDLELLQDLISFQLFRDRSYKQLDYKAFILYKLGQKERALAMISEINTIALQKGVKYKSMLYKIDIEK